MNGEKHEKPEEGQEVAKPVQHYAKKNSKAAALARLRAKREGKTVDSDNDDDDGDVYEYVDEEEYAKRTYEQANSNFVVDDDGRGYNDDGRAWWEDEHQYSEESEAEEDGAKNFKRHSGPGAKKLKKAKKENDPKQQSINSLFSGGGKQRHTVNLAHAQPKATNAQNDDFLDDLLQQLKQNPCENIKDFSARAKEEAQVIEDIALLENSSKASKVFQTIHTSLKHDVFTLPDKIKHESITCHSKSFDGELDSKAAISKVQVSTSNTDCCSTDIGTDSIATVTEHSPVHSSEIVNSIDQESDRTINNSVEREKEPTLKPTQSVYVTAGDSDDLVDDANTLSGFGTTTDWWTIRNQGSQQEPTQQPLPSQLQTTLQLPVTDVDGVETLRFYWIDALEDTFKSPGTIYLFGKVRITNNSTDSFESCCVTVQNIQRSLFFLPREWRLERGGHTTDEEVSMPMVYNEVGELMRRYGIPNWLAKPVERKYTFELDEIPAKSDYLKVKYDFRFPQLPMHFSGETFSHVFGTNTSCMELFLLKRKLMGPCWLDITNFIVRTTPVSWCKWDITVDAPTNVVKTPYTVPLPVPTLRIASMSIKTVVNSKSHKHEVVSISVLTHDSVNIESDTPHPESKYQGFTIIRRLSNEPFPFDFETTTKQKGITIQIVSNENALFNLFLAKLHRFDPDVLVGHNFFGFELDVILHRIQDLSIKQWSKLGRLKRSNLPKLGNGTQNGELSYAERAVIAGRLGISMWITSKELLTKVKSYSLQELARTQLGIEFEKLDFELIPNLYQTTAGLIGLVRHSENSAYLVMQLLFKLSVIPLSRQITCISGNVWSRTLTGGRAERNEHLLLHEFHARKFICPDKQKPNKEISTAPMNEEDEDIQSLKNAPKQAVRRKKAAYAGGLVLEPKKGFYDTYILLLDFNSLYPSIIQEYNICFTTVDRKNNLDGAEGDHTDWIPEVPDSSVEQGILPKLLATLVHRRKEVKNLIRTEREPAKLSEYDIRQRALKLTANSMYGCLGFTYSRFYAKPLAALITSRGRDILENTANLARTSLNLDVIYGDTDSIMINTRTSDISEVKKIGNQVKREVNKLYKLLEIDIDGMYKTMLLLKKKKYAALAVTEVDGQLLIQKETKGLDIVRRDWCTLSQDVGNDVLNLILSDTSGEELVNQIHQLLRDVGCQVESGSIPTEKFIINKTLTKDPRDYPDKKNQSHVQVALRMRQRGQIVNSRDTIPYVICAMDDKPSIADRARHPDDLARDPTLTIDKKYYLKQQLHPVVARLCEPIQGTDIQIIAECLGLDGASYAQQVRCEDEDEISYPSAQLSDEEKYRDARKWIVECPHCGVKAPFDGVVRRASENTNNDNDSYPSWECGLICPNRGCAKVYSTAWLCNMLTIAIRNHIQEYYKGYVRCDDPACGNRTRQLSVAGPNRCLVPYCTGKVVAEYTATALYVQLTYYQYLFDYKHAMNEYHTEDKIQKDIIGRATNAYISDMESLHRHVTSFIKKNARTYVDLARLFSMCTIVGSRKVKAA